MHSEIFGNLNNFRTLGLLMMVFGVINPPNATALEQVEVVKVAASGLHFKNLRCDSRYPLQSQKALLICGKTVALQTLDKRGKPLIAKVFGLEDAWIRRVWEFPLDKASISVGPDRLQALVLIDTGDEICYGTEVLGVTQNKFYRWGALDEVLDEQGDTQCISEKITLELSKAEVDIILAAPFHAPKADGNYALINKNRNYAVVKNGKFLKKK